jgi:hypothetical protein
MSRGSLKGAGRERDFPSVPPLKPPSISFPIGRGAALRAFAPEPRLSLSFLAEGRESLPTVAGKHAESAQRDTQSVGRVSRFALRALLVAFPVSRGLPVGRVSRFALRALVAAITVITVILGRAYISLSFLRVARESSESRVSATSHTHNKRAASPPVTMLSRRAVGASGALRRG